MTSDIKLSPSTHDLVFERDDLALFAKEEDSIRQRLKIGLSTVRGEWFLNTEKGLPITSPSFAQKGGQVVLDAYIRRFIEDFPGIQELSTYRSELDRATRIVKITFSARTTSGDIISFSEAI